VRMIGHKFCRILLLTGGFLTACTLASWSVAKEPHSLRNQKGRLVFARKHEGQWDIWSMRANGTELKQLTHDAHKDADPRWSPDGKAILYSSQREPIARVIRIQADGADAKEICEGKNPSWSPDGKRIVFVRDGQVFVRTLADATERRITPAMWDRCAFPVFHPKGDRIACSSRHGRKIAVYIVPLKNGTEEKNTRRVPTDKEACAPRWRPDGKRLLYQTSRHICAIDPEDGRPDDQLTFGGDVQRAPQYAPGGKAIVYCRAPETKGPWSLHVLDLASEEEIKLPVSGSCLYPDWRPERTEKQAKNEE